MLLLLFFEGSATGDETPTSRRAVKVLNGNASFVYSYAAAKLTDVPPSARRRTQADGWALGGRITAPIGQRFGVRVDLGGGKSNVQDVRSVLILEGESSFISPDFALFWRDPDRGTVGLGYGFSHSTTTTTRGATPTGLLLPPQPEQRTNAHMVSGFGELYVAAFDLGMAVSFSPRTSGLVANVRNRDDGTTAERIDLLVGPRWHLLDWLAFSARYRWTGTRAAIFGPVFPFPTIGEIGESESDTHAGAFQLVTQLPIGETRPIIITLFGDVGSNKTEFPFPALGTTRTYGYELGAVFTFSYPAPKSLREWYREYL